MEEVIYLKSIFDNFVSTIFFVIIVFAISSFIIVEMQLLSARHIHSSAINQIQSSYYMVDIDKINEKIEEMYPSGDWYIESTVINSVHTRQDRLVKLHYSVKLPLFQIQKNGVIEGYAR